MADPVFKVPSIDYSSRDFESIRDDLINLIPFFTPKWTDHNPSDLGIVLIEMLSYNADGLHFYADRTLADGFVDTSVTQAAHDSLNKLINYVPTGSSASTGEVTFVLSQVQPANITIPALTQIATSGVPSITFETDIDVIIPAGQLTAKVAVSQGRTTGKVTDIANAELVGVSNGTPFQTFVLDEGPVIAGSTKPHVDEGLSGAFFEYFEVSNFSGIEADDRVFVRGIRPDGLTEITFGDGVTGRIPPSLSPIRVPYRVGGGSAGNVGSSTVQTIVTTISGAPPLSVNNTNAMSGGSDPETISEQKENAPLSLTAIGRAVTVEDYKAIAKTVSSVYDAYVFFKSNSATANVAIAPFGGGLPSSTLKSQVRNLLDIKNCLGTEVVVVDPTIIPINIEGTVTLKPNASQAILKETVTEIITDFLDFGSNTSVSKFNKSVYLSDVTCVIDEIEGVDHVDFVKLTRTPITLLGNWRDSAGDISIVVGDNNTIEQTLTITMDSDAPDVMEYHVVGTVSGVLGTGTATISPVLPTPLLLFGGGVDLQISVQFSSSTAIGPSDTIVVTVGKFLGNQTITGREIATSGSLVFAYIGGT